MVRFLMTACALIWKIYGYAPVWHTPALWKHETRYIIFKMVVYGFGINFTISKDA